MTQDGKRWSTCSSTCTSWTWNVCRSRTQSWYFRIIVKLVVPQPSVNSQQEGLAVMRALSFAIPNIAVSKSQSLKKKLEFEL